MARSQLLRGRAQPIPHWSVAASSRAVEPQTPQEASESIDLPAPPPAAAGLRIRRDQRDWTSDDWQAFIAAIDAAAAPDATPPTYNDFVSLHAQAMTTAAGMTWGVHSMEMPGGMTSDGRNFLPWHREFLVRLELRLGLTLPYWNWVDERAIPAALSNPTDLHEWNVTRAPGAGGIQLPSAISVHKVLNASDFKTFSDELQDGPHNQVHRWVGGTMATASSPADPLFWLHHAFVDRLWVAWAQEQRPAQPQPPNLDEILQPPPMITGRVADQLDTAVLGYTYM
jgi:Common central domain of tyrosinase